MLMATEFAEFPSRTSTIAHIKLLRFPDVPVSFPDAIDHLSPTMVHADGGVIKVVTVCPTVRASSSTKTRDLSIGRFVVKPLEVRRRLLIVTIKVYKLCGLRGREDVRGAQV